MANTPNDELLQTTGLKQYHLKVSTVVFMIFCLCAAGAYGIEEMIAASGPGLTIVMLIILPIVWSTPLGLIASELGSVRPQEGGYYKWVQEALGEFWGFQAGWWRTISIYIDNSLYVILAGSYISAACDLSGTAEFLVKALIIAIFTYVNLRGVVNVGKASTVISVLVIAIFTLVTVCGFLNWNFNPFVPFTACEGITGIVGISGADWVYYIGTSIAIGMWMYAGYESMSTLAGELINPQVITKATMISVPMIMATYILPTVAALGAIGNWQNWGTESGMTNYADVLTTYWSPAFGMLFVIIAVLAQCSIYNTYIASGSRGFFALAADKLAPPVLIKCDKKRGVPYVAVLSVAAVNLILCNFAFEIVVVVDVFLLTMSYIMIFISAMILRKRIPAEEYKFRIKGGYPVLCLVCLVPILVGFIAFFINGTNYFIGGMLGLISGPIVYIIWKKRYGGLAKLDSQKYPLNPKTGLARGDLKRVAAVFLLLAVLGAIACLFLPWFEGDWGNDYYFEQYGIQGFFDTMMLGIKAMTGICAVVSVVIVLIARKLESSPRL